MGGQEEKLARDTYVADDTEGIIPRAVQYLWQTMTQRPEKFYVKSSFMEIYNEQIRDLLNPGSGVLHCRWNIKNVTDNQGNFMLVGFLCGRSTSCRMSKR